MIAPALALLLTLGLAQSTGEQVKSDVKAAVKEVGEVGKRIGRAAKEGGKDVGRAVKPAGKRVGEGAKTAGQGIAKGAKEAAKGVKDAVTK